MPPDLQELMRHASIETTMKYYVGRHAEAAAKTLWESMGAQAETENSEELEPLKIELAR